MLDPEFARQVRNIPDSVAMGLGDLPYGEELLMQQAGITRPLVQRRVWWLMHQRWVLGSDGQPGAFLRQRQAPSRRV